MGAQESRRTARIPGFCMTSAVGRDTGRRHFASRPSRFILGAADPEPQDVPAAQSLPPKRVGSAVGPFPLEREGWAENRLPLAGFYLSAAYPDA